MKKFHSLDYKTVLSILEKCQQKGSQSVYLSGGDVFSWEHWAELLQDERIKLDITITTPLVIPRYQGGFNLDLLRRVKWLRVSLDSVDRETFKKIRGVDKISQVKHDLTYLMANNICEDVGVATVLQKENRDQLSEIGGYLVHLGIKRWIVQPVDYHPDLSVEKGYDIREIGKELEQEFGSVIPINNFNVLIENFFMFNECKDLPCIVPRMTAFIDTRLRVWPCCNLCQDSKGDEERVKELLMGQFEGGSLAGSYFLELWKKKRKFLDEYKHFKDIHPLCEKMCRFKYFYYNLGYRNWCEQRSNIYL